MKDDRMRTSRRAFLGGVAATAALAACGGLAGVALAAETTATAGGSKSGGLPMARLGRRLTVSRLCVGGAHAGEMERAAGGAMLERAFELGVNFYDSAHSYGSAGQSEKLLGDVFSGMRDRVVLMSKSTQRDAGEAERELDESLRRMKTDHLDLWQIHALGSPADAERAVAKGGVLETARRALRDGRVRTLGATGHKSPEAIVRILELIPELEVVQIPVNCADPHFNSFVRIALPAARARGVDVLAMKTLARGSLATAAGVTVDECHRYALSQPVAAWVSGMTSMEQLLQNAALLRGFTPMTKAEQDALLARTEAMKGLKTEDYKGWPQ